MWNLGSAFFRNILRLSKQVYGFSDIGVIDLYEKPSRDCDIDEKFSEVYENLKAAVMLKHEWAKTIIVLIWPYTPYKVEFPDGLGIYSAHYKQYPIGRKAAYHLSSFIEKAGFRTACDSGIPVKPAAFCTGLGKYGRNSLIYTKEYGSWVTIHTVVTNAVFDYDNNFAKNITDCGNCTVCVDACPTKAIMYDGKLNKSRCLREHMLPKNIVPIEIRKHMGRCILGCDTCQIICPKNKERFTKAVLPDADEIKTFDIENILSGSDDLNEILKHTGTIIGTNYAKEEQILSAAAIIAGNVKEIKLIPHLTKLLHHPFPPVRAHAAWALVETDRKSAKDALTNAIIKEPDEFVKLEMKRLIFA